jgi:Uma2 family endonuclease
LSPDSALRDLNLNKAVYERFGIPSYWIIDPDLDQPSLQAFELVDGAYHDAAQAAGMYRSMPNGHSRLRSCPLTW